MLKTPKFISPEELISMQEKLMKEGGIQEVAVVKNPSYVRPEFDFYPLAPRSQGNLSSLTGVVKDMDGTTTTTEVLCLHSLEYMVRQITGRMEPAAWSGLDRDRDYPFIIGNSTTRHVEYLIRTYEKDIQIDALGQSFLRAALWTLSVGQDPGRRREVEANLALLGLLDFKSEEIIQDLMQEGRYDDRVARNTIARYWETQKEKARLSRFEEIVRAAIDIYYMRYHEILAALASGSGKAVAREVLGDESRRLIDPMPGVGIHLAMIKGWLGEELECFGDKMMAHLKEHAPPEHLPEIEKNLKYLGALGRYFERHPIKVGVVTSSIDYEADIVLGSVFEVLRERVASWQISSKRKERILMNLGSYRRFYDAYVTASDSSEIRLKPHRDLYSIALHLMGIAPEEFDRVVGFEDSESGTIAIRAAGIGLCVAVPFADTAGHDLSAAAFCLQGGLFEAILRYLHFLNPEVLEQEA